MTGAGRKPDGQIIKRWRSRDRQHSYALRVRYGRDRVYVRLGLEAEGWSDRTAELELERVLEEIAIGVWRPPIPEVPDGDRDPTLHEFASWWLADREAEIGQSAHDD